MVKVTKKDIKTVGPQLGKPLVDAKVTQPPAGGWGAGPTTPKPAGGWKKDASVTGGDRAVKSAQYITDPKGNITGLRLPGGKDYLGSAADMRAIMEKYNKNRAVEEEPGVLSEFISEEEEEEERKKKAAELVGGLGGLSPEILAQAQAGGIDIMQALGGGVTAAIPGIIGGAVTGLATGGALSVPLAAAGGVAAFLFGIRGNLKSQQSGKIQASSQSLAEGQMVLRRLVTAANSDPTNHVLYMDMFNEQLSYIERDYGSLQLETEGFLKDLSGADGTPQLADYERFYQAGGLRDYYMLQMQMAIANPNPTKMLVTPEELVS